MSLTSSSARKNLNNEFKSEHFVFFYSDSLEKESLEDVVLFYENGFKEHKNFFKLSSDFYASVYIFDDLKSFQLATYGEEKTVYCIDYSEYRIIAMVNPHVSKKNNLSDHYIKSSNFYCLYDMLFMEMKNKNNKWLLDGVCFLFSNFYTREHIFKYIESLSTENFDRILNNDKSFFNNFGKEVFLFALAKFIEVKYSNDSLQKLVFSNEDIFEVLNISKENFLDEFNKYIFSDEFLIPKILNCKKITDHFIFYYNDSLEEKTFNDFYNYLNDNYKKVCKFFDVKDDFCVRVSIYPTINSFHMSLFDQEYARWCQGCNEHIMINITDPKDTAPEHTYSNTIRTLLHEFVHYITFFDSNNPRPSWLAEGIAMYLGNPIPKEEITLYIKNHKFLDEIIFGDDYSKFQNNGGYSVSQTIIEYILKNYSLDLLKNILKTPEEDPFKILNIEKEVFIKDWREFLFREYA